MFLVGLYDEFRLMTPIAKLVAVILRHAGHCTWHYQHIFHAVIRTPCSCPTSVHLCLLVGITNATNLLDNMDLSGCGIVLPPCGVGIFLLNNGDQTLLWVALVSVGSLLGFNELPTRQSRRDMFGIYTAEWRLFSSSRFVVHVVGVPTLIFLPPILDDVCDDHLPGGNRRSRASASHLHRLVAGIERALLFSCTGRRFPAVMARCLNH
jgi:hypothetical protein